MTETGPIHVEPAEVLAPGLRVIQDLRAQVESLRAEVEFNAQFDQQSIKDLAAERDRLIQTLGDLTKELTGTRSTDTTEAWEVIGAWQEETLDLEAERDRLVKALERIADLPNGLSHTGRTIAREALTKTEEDA